MKKIYGMGQQQKREWWRMRIFMHTKKIKKIIQTRMKWIDLIHKRKNKIKIILVNRTKFIIW